MSADLRVAMLEMFMREGDRDAAHQYAARLLRAGNVSDELARMIADAMEMKGKRGRPAKRENIELAQAVLDAQDRQPRGRKKLAAAIAEAAEAERTSIERVEHAWKAWGPALLETRKVDAEAMEEMHGHGEK